MEKKIGIEILKVGIVSFRDHPLTMQKRFSDFLTPYPLVGKNRFFTSPPPSNYIDKALRSPPYL